MNLPVPLPLLVLGVVLAAVAGVRSPTALDGLPPRLWARQLAAAVSAGQRSRVAAVLPSVVLSALAGGFHVFALAARGADLALTRGAGRLADHATGGDVDPDLSTAAEDDPALLDALAAPGMTADWPSYRIHRPRPHHLTRARSRRRRSFPG